MSAPEFVSEANRWLRFAAEDLNVAQNLLASNESAPRHICFLAQQSAEKALKAALVLEEMDFPVSARSGCASQSPSGHLAGASWHRAYPVDCIGTRSQQYTLNSDEICPINPNRLCREITENEDEAACSPIHHLAQCILGQFQADSISITN